jgi:aspartyl-tRNA(Asn)/glutamyl-tRNA(Gln) amidotransferase subunit A
MLQLHELTITEAARRIRDRELSSVELLDAYLKRIEALDPLLRAWVTVDLEGARDAARERDREIKLNGHPRGPLHGIPVGIKDVFCTNGLRTTACSPLLAQFIPDYDATSVQLLRANGAIILGKTVCTEFAANDPPRTLNPWNTSHTPGGSSSGSAVAVATHMCAATLDTQSAGDVLRPAAYNGIVGFKPTHGRISRYGMLPVAWSVDCAGVQAHTVEDVALMLQVLACPDPCDLSCSIHPVPDYMEMVRHQIKAPRLGLVRNFFYDHSNEEVRQHTDHIVELLQQKGAICEEISLPEDMEIIYAAHRIVAFAECAAYHQEMFFQHNAEYGPKMHNLVELGLVTPASAYLQAQRLRRRARRNIQDSFNGFDALITPATPSTAPKDTSMTGQPVLNIPWTYCGFPSIALPSGIGREGLPLGIQLVGPLFAEDKLFAVAHWCEDVLDFRLSPCDPINTVA